MTQFRSPGVSFHVVTMLNVSHTESCAGYWGAGTPEGWQQPWHITEDPTCAFGPTASTVASTTSPLTSTTKINYKWPGGTGEAGRH